MAAAVPGAGVVLMVQVCLLGLASAALEFSVTPLESSLLLSWTGDPAAGIGSFDVRIGGISQKTGTGAVLGQDGEMEVGSGLIPGETYTVTVHNTTNTAAPQSLFEEPVTLKPSPPVLNPIEDSSVTTDSMMLMWSAGPGKRDKYVVTYLDVSETAAREQIKTVDEPTRTLFLSDLAPGHNYSFTLQAQSGMQFSNEISTYENTRPLSPNITEVTARDSTRLLLKWVPGGGSLQSSYQVTYNPTFGDSSSVVPVSGCNSSPCEVVVADTFPPGTGFLLRVYAVQGQRRSAEASMSANTSQSKSITL